MFSQADVPDMADMLDVPDVPAMSYVPGVFRTRLLYERTYEEWFERQVCII